MKKQTISSGYHHFALLLLSILGISPAQKVYGLSLTSKSCPSVRIPSLSTATTASWKTPHSTPAFSRLGSNRIKKTHHDQIRPSLLFRSPRGDTALHMSDVPAASGIMSDDDNTPPSSTKASRPEWACDWMPTWLITMRPALQLLVGLSLYVFHLTVLTQNCIAFPVQLIPNDRGHFQSIGLDSLAGMLSLFGCMYLSKTTRNNPKPAVPSIWSSPSREDAPWRFRKASKNTVTEPGARSTSIIGFIALIQAYFYTGRFSLFWEDFLYSAAGIGIPMTVAMHRSLCVLLGHLTWIGIGGAILKVIPRPQPFFGGGYKTVKDPSKEGGTVKQKRKFRWYTSNWDTYWLWWTMGGYFVSSWVFNIADFINQMVLPAAVFETAAEGVVSQLINPENNDLAASLVGYIAPCITAPWWEEVLYRGFMLPAMCLHLKYWFAVFMSGVVFSAHHLSTTGAIPLAFLGWIWAAIYAKSGNLVVTILIHAMWNSRVFLGSWLGL